MACVIHQATVVNAALLHQLAVFVSAPLGSNMS
jgi:hypothetical protein